MTGTGHDASPADPDAADPHAADPGVGVETNGDVDGSQRDDEAGDDPASHDDQVAAADEPPGTYERGRRQGPAGLALPHRSSGGWDRHDAISTTSWQQPPEHLVA